MYSYNTVLRHCEDYLSVQRGTGPWTPCPKVVAAGGFSKEQEKGELMEILSETSKPVFMLRWPSRLCQASIPLAFAFSEMDSGRGLILAGGQGVQHH